MCSMVNACFVWSVTAAFYPAKSHVVRKSYPYYATMLNLEVLEFPVTLKQITKFELLMIYLSYLPSGREVGKKMLLT